MIPEITSYKFISGDRALPSGARLVGSFEAAIGPFRVFGGHVYEMADGAMSVQTPKVEHAQRGIALRGGPLKDQLRDAAIRHHRAMVEALGRGRVAAEVERQIG
jgi:hypothetical protein